MNEIMKEAVVIDTDPGVDDAASLFWVITNGRFDIKAITIANGNVGLDLCALNALKILDACKRTDIPVYKGGFRPFLRKPMDAAWVHGRDGLGDAGFPDPGIRCQPGFAPAEIVRIAKESPEPITILALAPLTNVALAILLDAKLKNHVKRILFMGGAVRVPGNESPVASFNPAIDPEAAKIVYNSGIPVVQLGLDVCDRVRQTDEDLERIRQAGTPVSDFIIRMLRHIREKSVRTIRDAGGDIIGEQKASDKPGEIGLNDLTATAYLINPDWFKVRHLYIDIDTTGLCPGQTVADFKGLWGRKPNAAWAYEVDSRAAMETWVKDIVSYKEERENEKR